MSHISFLFCLHFEDKSAVDLLIYHFPLFEAPVVQSLPLPYGVFKLCNR